MSLPKDYVEELNTLNRRILKAQPSDVIQFCADYFNSRLKENQTGSRTRPRDEDSESDEFQTQSKATLGTPVFNVHSFDSADSHHSSPDDPKSSSESNRPRPPLPEKLHQRSGPPTKVARAEPVTPQGFNFGRRSSVSAESIDPSTISSVPVEELSKKVNLSSDQLIRLNQSIANNLLFTSLDEDSRATVLAALKEMPFDKGTWVIQQGEEGDYFYVVETGTVDYFKDGHKVSSSGPGSSFGELALMYNAPRAASVLANTNCVLWALDRITFKQILLESTWRKRQKYGQFLHHVPILSSLSSYELSKLSDALNSEVYESGQKVIQQGDVGDNFYLIESGTASVSREGQGVVKELREGDYFGEVALLNDLPRQATVVATSKLRVAGLGKSGFQRLLGQQVVDILTRQDPTQGGE